MGGGFVAPTSYPHAIGTSGIPFGGGQFTWEILPTGQMGWKAPSGEFYDGSGNKVQVPTSAPAPQQQVSAAGTPNLGPQPLGGQSLATLQTSAQDILAGLPAPNKINSYAFGKLPTSAQQFVLGGYEAKGYDPNDVQQTIQNILPKAIGPRHGYIAPLGT